MTWLRVSPEFSASMTRNVYRATRVTLGLAVVVMTAVVVCVAANAAAWLSYLQSSPKYPVKQRSQRYGAAGAGGPLMHREEVASTVTALGKMTSGGVMKKVDMAVDACGTHTSALSHVMLEAFDGAPGSKPTVSDMVPGMGTPNVDKYRIIDVLAGGGRVACDVVTGAPVVVTTDDRVVVVDAFCDGTVVLGGSVVV